MKRNEIQIGTEYAVLSPSQRDKVDGRYGPVAKHVRVLDTEPRWVERQMSFSRPDTFPRVAIVGFDGEEVEARDLTASAENDYTKREARRYVRVLAGRNSVYSIEVVSSNMIAMSWSEYEERRAKALDAAKRQDEARAALKLDIEREEAEIRGLEAEAGVAGQAEFRLSGFRNPEVSLTRGQYAAFLKKVTALRKALQEIVDEEPAVSEQDGTCMYCGSRAIAREVLSDG